MYAQITVNECIENGLKHRPSIKTIRSCCGCSKSLDAQSKFLPQIALAYEYRYNPIIATQVVPTGLFSGTPTTETQAIRFGTKWQQNAGVTVYQPLIDLSLKSKIKESKINEASANWDLKKAEEDFVFEIIKSYSQILLYQLQSKNLPLILFAVIFLWL
jgi:outer membrane protein TolC